MSDARSRWKAFWRNLRITRRETAKAAQDVAAFGTGIVFVGNDGSVAHVAYRSSVTLDEAIEQGWFG